MVRVFFAKCSWRGISNSWVGSVLTVVGRGAVFAREMLLREWRGCRPAVRTESQGLKGHLRNDFEGFGGLKRFGTAGPPGERAVIAHEDSRHLERVGTLEALCNPPSGFPLVVALNFGCGEGSRDGRGTVEIVGVGGAEGCDLNGGLRERECSHSRR